MKRYAMPVHREVEDFESDEIIDEIPDLILMLKEINTIEEYLTIDYNVNSILRKLWFEINLKRGINLRDREKLYPVFSELNRILKGDKTVSFAYRGVRASNFDPNIISENYSFDMEEEIIPREPRVLEHLESLAYGLRSWTKKYLTSLDWANSQQYTTKDRIIFQIDHTDVVLDADAYLKASSHRTYSSAFDSNEVILLIKNPKIKSIQKVEDGIYLVKIKDN